MKPSNKLLGALLLSLILISCKKESFDTKNSDFQNIYNSLLQSGLKEKETMDNEVHSYTFTLSEDRSLGLIGYESHKELKSTDYVIEIRRNTDSTIVFSGAHQFDSKEMSYVSPLTPVDFQAGVSYTVQRIQTNWGDNIGRTIGKMISTTGSDYPMSHGIMTITDVDFHDYNAVSHSLDYYALPRIDLVFE